MSRATRAEWEKRVERWQSSGLTAKEFAAELDVSPSTLTYWKLKLRREKSVKDAAPELISSQVLAAGTSDLNRPEFPGGSEC